MEIWKRSPALMVVVLVLGFFLAVEHAGGQLSPNFYQSSCPNVESIVKEAVKSKFRQTLATVASTLRLFFHDCLVEGCDASIMIALRGGGAEKEAPENLSLPGDGFDTVIKAKQAVEAQCPGVVSCADILALAARDAVALVGGPAFTVELGRRDGTISQAGRVAGRIPSPDWNVDQLNAFFRQLSLSTEDMVALSGAHTVGLSHCKPFMRRLYGFNASRGVDPLMNPAYAAQLKKVCPPDVDPDIAVVMDFDTPLVFDNAYYKHLLLRAGTFTSDQALYYDGRTSRTVRRFADDQAKFFQAFAAAMVKLGRVGVKTGAQGQIRRDCTTFG